MVFGSSHALTNPMPEPGSLHFKSKIRECNFSGLKERAKILLICALFNYTPGIFPVILFDLFSKMIKACIL